MPHLTDTIEQVTRELEPEFHAEAQRTLRVLAEAVDLFKDTATSTPDVESDGIFDEPHVELSSLEAGVALRHRSLIGRIPKDTGSNLAEWFRRLESRSLVPPASSLNYGRCTIDCTLRRPFAASSRADDVGLPGGVYTLGENSMPCPNAASGVDQCAEHLANCTTHFPLTWVLLAPCFFPVLLVAAMPRWW